MTEDYKIARLMLAKSYAIKNVSCSQLDNLYFRQAIHYINPKFALPSSKTMKRDVDELFHNTKIQIGEDLRNNKFVLSSDGWISHNGTFHVYSVLAYFVDADFSRKYKVLVYNLVAVKSVENQRSETLRALFEEVFMELNIPLENNLLGAVTDGAANIRKSVRLMNVESVRCCAHAIHLIVFQVTSTDPMKTILEKCKNIVRVLHQSANAQKEFETKVVGASGNGKTIRGFSQTRWLAAVDLVRECLEYSNVLDNMEVMDPFELDEEEKKTAGYFVRIGHILKNTLNEFEARNSLVSIVIPELYHVLKVVVSSGEFANENDPNHLLAVSFSSAIERRLKEFLNSNVHVSGMIFDPRTFLLDILPESISWVDIKDIGWKIFELFESFCSLQQMNKIKKQQPADSFWRSIQEKCTDSANRTYAQEINKELSQYECELQNGARPSEIDDVFDFWKTRKVTYPVLSQIARIILSFPASSADNERIFSRASQLLSDKKRANMQPDTLEKFLVVSQDDFEEQEKELKRRDKQCKSEQPEYSYSLDTRLLESVEFFECRYAKLQNDEKEDVDIV